MMWGPTTAGVVAGLPLAFTSAAVLACLLPVSLETRLAITAALALPLWCGTISLAFFTRNGLKAWAALLAGNAVCAALLFGFTLAGLYGVPEALR